MSTVVYATTYDPSIRFGYPSEPLSVGGRAMAVPTHFRFVVRGVFLGSPEEWSTSCHFTRANSSAGDAGLDDINEGNVTTAVTAYFNSNIFPGDVVVRDWRFYVIGTDNTMQGNGPLIHEYTDDAVAGTGSTWRLPPQVALVHTLMAANRGPAQYGRMYMPHPSLTLESDGRISSALATAFNNAHVNFLKAVSDCIDLTFPASSAACNVSPGPSGSSTGTLQQIDHVETGRVLDTIRNRRKSMVEERVASGHIDW